MKMKGLAFAGDYMAIDLDHWHAMTPKTIRQVRARQVEYGKMACPACGEMLVLPLVFFTVKLDGTIVSDRKLACAGDSKAHGYHGGCGHQFTVKKTRELK